MGREDNELFIWANFSRLRSFIRASCSRLRSSVHHVVADAKLGPPGKLFVLKIFSGFIGFCRVSVM